MEPKLGMTVLYHPEEQPGNPVWAGIVNGVEVFGSDSEISIFVMPTDLPPHNRIAHREPMVPRCEGYWEPVK